MLDFKDWLHIFGLVGLVLAIATAIVLPSAVIVYFAIESGSWLLVALAFVVYIATISLAVYLYQRYGR